MFNKEQGSSAGSFRFENIDWEEVSKRNPYNRAKAEQKFRENYIPINTGDSYDLDMKILGLEIVLRELQAQKSSLETEVTTLKQQLKNAQGENTGNSNTTNSDLSDPEGYCKVLGLKPELLHTLPDRSLVQLLQSLYRAYSKVHHPDIGGDTEEMKKVNVAFEFLKNPTNRRNYPPKRKI